jgi:hypothetical protein
VVYLTFAFVGYVFMLYFCGAFGLYLYCAVYYRGGWRLCGVAKYVFLVIPFYLQSVLVYSANYVKTCIQWHVEECSLALLCN